MKQYTNLTVSQAFDELNQGERTADAMEDHLDAIEAKIQTMLEDAKAAGVDLGDLDSKATDGDQRDSQTG